MIRNRGKCPTDAEGKRVRVLLANGAIAGPWPADGKAGCRWTIVGHPFDIKKYEVVA